VPSTIIGIHPGSLLFLGAIEMMQWSESPGNCGTCGKVIEGWIAEEDIFGEDDDRKEEKKKGEVEGGMYYRKNINEEIDLGERPSFSSKWQRRGKKSFTSRKCREKY